MKHISKIINLLMATTGISSTLIVNYGKASSIIMQEQETCRYSAVLTPNIENIRRQINIKSYQIPLSAKEEFEIFVSQSTNDPYEQPSLTMEIMGNKLKSLLPQDIKDALRNMGRNGNPSAIILKGLPIDSYIPNHENIKERVNQKTRVSENVILGITNVMDCEARPNPKEQEGRIIHNVAPLKQFENTRSSRGKEPLYLHTEETFEDFPPDFLMLYSLVADPKAQTTYCFVEDFLYLFPYEIIEEMKKLQFEIKSNEGALDQPTYGTYSLIKEEEVTEAGTKLRLRLKGNMEDFKPLTSQAKKVIDYVNNFFLDIKPEGVSLNSGEALIFNNGWGINKVSGIMHGRGGFIENPNRWLQRAFIYRKQSQIS
jgi:hypothetical protein